MLSIVQEGRDAHLISMVPAEGAVDDGRILAGGGILQQMHRPQLDKLLGSWFVRQSPTFCCWAYDRLAPGCESAVGTAAA